MDLHLMGKRAIVTGGSRGIGRAIAHALAEEGVDVVIAARTREPLNQAATEIATATNRRVIGIAADMADDNSVDALVEGAVRALGGVDILVNNAAAPGAGKAAKIGDVVTANLLTDVDAKVGGYIRAARAVAPHMAAAGYGRIVNIGGLAARRTGNYVSALRNAAISAITKNLADELGPRGVGAIAIHPGFLRTPGADAAAEARAQGATSYGRLIGFEEIASLVVLLASPRTAVLNGDTLQAVGGVRGVIDY